MATAEHTLSKGRWRRIVKRPAVRIAVPIVIVVIARVAAKRAGLAGILADAGHSGRIGAFPPGLLSCRQRIGVSVKRNLDRHHARPFGCGNLDRDLRSFPSTLSQRALVGFYVARGRLTISSGQSCRSSHPGCDRIQFPDDRQGQP